MIDPDALLNDLKPQVRALENDLRDRADESEFAGPLKHEWDEAVRRSRTAATYETWLEDQITQSAVAWVLNTVFLRFCEDNHLIADVFLSGRGERLDLAKERQQLYFEQPDNANKTDREWIEEGLKAMAKASPVAAGLFDRDHNPMWRITPSLEGAKALIDFWRHTRPALPDEGTDVATVPVHDFTDAEWNTRFLGNLYQDLSEHAKKKYALLQTPEFVEEFILGLTLDEAINEFGLDPEPPEACPEELNLPRGLRVIDPTCGSGHFLLGAFHHIFERWQAQAPGVDKWDLIHRTLYSVHGVDKNPFAVAVARFRLLIAAMQAAEVKKLSDAPDFTLNIAVGDSLIHGRGGPELDQGRWEFSDNGEVVDPEPVFTYATEDVSDYAKTVDLLGVGSYHVVVGNPPYITVKDKTENKNYRYYKSAYRSYALSVPFAERFFQLAIRAGQDRRGAGYVGQITANSFMKREFGKKLIEEFFPTIRLTHVIDTSGAYIPHHGTPTVILIGRRVYPLDEPVRAILSIRGEPKQPKDASKGIVWSAIVQAIKTDDLPDETWVSPAAFLKSQIKSHPWSLGGGGASELMEELDSSPHKLSAIIKEAGLAVITGEDSAFLIRPTAAAKRRGLFVRPAGEGTDIRDWGLKELTWLLSMYDDDWSLNKPTSEDKTLQFLWPLKVRLFERKRFSIPLRERGAEWYEWREVYPSKLRAQLRLCIPLVATHNHVYLERRPIALKHSVTVITLPDTDGADTYLELAAVLNSSTACFWLKQVCHDKGSGGIGGGIAEESWEHFFEFTGTKLQNFPLPEGMPRGYGQELDRLAKIIANDHPSNICQHGTPGRQELRDAQYRHSKNIRKAISLQEELDWEVYRHYGLLNDEEASNLIADPGIVPEIELGERAFEILLARKVASGEVDTEWFVRHDSTPITELPAHWPEAYRLVVDKRIEAIESRPQTIGLIEQPEHKRRWAAESWADQEEAALRDWLLNRCEAPELWFTPDDSGVEQPRAMTIGRLTDRLQEDQDFVSVARLYAGEGVELIDVLTKVLDAEHVPFISALRYRDSGLRKRTQWDKTWRLQRNEEETGKRLNIKPPPNYNTPDFAKNSYWRNRGKLDMPKERFISYPGASPDGDKTLLIGWAGWDHAEQAHALVTLIEERTTRDGWELERLMPLLAGLDEVMPWVKQWHSEVDPMTGLSPAVAYEGYLQEQVERHPELSREELALWRPPKKAGRKKSAK